MSFVLNRNFEIINCRNPWVPTFDVTKMENWLNDGLVSICVNRGLVSNFKMSSGLKETCYQRFQGIKLMISWHVTVMAKSLNFKIWARTCTPPSKTWKSIKIDFPFFIRVEACRLDPRPKSSLYWTGIGFYGWMKTDTAIIQSDTARIHPVCSQIKPVCSQYTTIYSQYTAIYSQYTTI